MPYKLFHLVFLAVILYAYPVWAGSGIFINGDEVPEAEVKAATQPSSGPVVSSTDITSPEDNARNAQIQEEERQAKEQEAAAERQAAEEKEDKRIKGRIGDVERKLNDIEIDRMLGNPF